MQNATWDVAEPESASFTGTKSSFYKLGNGIRDSLTSLGSIGGALNSRGAQNSRASLGGRELQDPRRRPDARSSHLLDLVRKPRSPADLPPPGEERPTRNYSVLSDLDRFLNLKGDGFHDPLGEKHGHNWPSREDALRGTVRVQRHSASQPSLQAFQSSAHHQPLLQTNAHRLGYLSQNGVGARGGKTTGHTQRHRASWTAQMNPEDDPSKAGGSETTGSNPVKRMSSPAVLAIRRSSLISSESSVSTCNDSDSSRTNQTETGQLNLRELLGDKHHEKLSAEFFQKHGIEDQSKDERKKEGVKSVMEETPRTTKKLSPEEQKEDTGDDVTTRMRDINKQLKEFKEELRRYKRRSIANAYAHQKISLPCDPMDRSYLHLSPRTPAEAEVISIHGMPRGQKNEGAVEMKNTMMRREEIHQPYLLNRERGLSDIPADTVDGPRSSVVDDSGWYYGTKAVEA